MCQSGDGPDITLTDAEKPPSELKDRWKVTEKMYMVPQYAFAGDYTGKCVCHWLRDEAHDSLHVTVEAIAKGVNEVAKFDAGEYSILRPTPVVLTACLDDWFVIAITVGFIFMVFGRY